MVMETNQCMLKSVPESNQYWAMREKFHGQGKNAALMNFNPRQSIVDKFWQADYCAQCPDTLNILMYMFCGPYFGKVIKLPIYNTYLL